MADSSRFIEVITQATVDRSVRSYRSEVTLYVNARRQADIVATSLELRDRLLRALKQAGLQDDEIVEGGASLAKMYWSRSRSITHELQIEHKDMSVLMQAMAEVERTFSDVKQGFWSPIQHHFAFSNPKPRFVPDPQNKHDLLRQAIETAQNQAAVLAQQATLQITGVRSITQLESGLQTQAGRSGSETDDDAFMDFDESEFGAGDYQTAADPKSPASNWYRVKFDVATAE